jgi:hypothetical protein
VAQCDYGAWQARTPIYLGGRPKASRSLGHECVGQNNPLARLHHNEHKPIARVRRHTNLEWDRLQVTLQNTFEVPKLALVYLISSHIFYFLA